MAAVAGHCLTQSTKTYADEPGDRAAALTDGPTASAGCGDGMCRAKELFACPGDCRNIVRNPRFDGDQSGWRASRSGAARTISEAGNRVLRLDNATGGDLSVSQLNTIGGDIDDAYAVGYRVKALAIPDGGTVTLDAVVLYADGKKDFIIDPFRVGPDEVGKWVERYTELPRGRAIQSINLLLFANGRGASACFDDVTIARLDADAGFAFETQTAKIVINDGGTLVSIRHGDRELLPFPEPIAMVMMNDGAEFPSRGVERLADGSYHITFGDCPVALRATITSHDRYIAFRLDAVVDVDERVRRIDLFRVQPAHIPHRAVDMRWAMDASADEVFFNAVPLDANALCYDEGSRLVCRFSPFLGWSGGGALVITTKQHYWDALEDIAREQSPPFTKSDDGNWFRKSLRLRDSYLFPTLTPANADHIRELARRGGFRDILIHEVRKGTYDKPIHFESLDALREVAERFHGDGIAINLHVFANQVQQEGDVVDFRNPETPLADIVYSIPVGRLATDIDASQRSIPLVQPVEQSPEFRHFAIQPDGYSFGTIWDWGLFLIDDEIVRCKGCTGATLPRAHRGAEGTRAASHAHGAEVRYVPRTAGYFINPGNAELRRRSVEGMARTLDALGANFVYFDGFTFLSQPGMDAYEFRALSHKLGVMPYLAAAGNRMAQLGGSSPPMGWFYAGRVATDDAPTFRNKEFAREHKVRSLIAADNPFDQTLREMGWWKVHAAAFDQGYDHDAVTLDDVHYVMGKVLAYDIPLGAQFGFQYERHARLGEIFDLIGRYHALRDAYRKAPLIPRRLRDWLRDADAEAELSNASGWHLVRKTTATHRLAWTQDAPAECVIDNPLASQPLKFELRPRFDYTGLDAPGNYPIFDRTRPAIEKVDILGEGIQLKVEDDGWITIRNAGSQYGSCRLQLQGKHVIGHRRGVGLRMAGDRRKALVIVSWVQGGFARRDYNVLVDFNGVRDIVLDSPTTDEFDVVDGEVVTPGEVSKQRHWEIDLNKAVTFEIQIQNIAPHSQMRLQFQRVVALEEKPDSPIVNPVLSFGGQDVRFPLTLKLNDRDGYALQYDGRTGEYCVLSSNRAVVANGTTDKVRLEPGRNRLRVTSDTSNPGSGSRAELIVHLYDDQDGDGVPDDGDLAPNGRPCSGEDQFCDDNCPTVWNPDQGDTDNDGIGDACDTHEGE